MRRMVTSKEIEEIAKLFSVQKAIAENTDKVNELLKFEALDSSTLQITFKSQHPENFCGIIGIYSIVGEDDSNFYLI